MWKRKMEMKDTDKHLQECHSEACRSEMLNGQPSAEG